jgi:hypothetical protein
MQRLAARLTLLFVAVLIAGGCNLTLLPGGGGAGTGACLPGTWNVQSEMIKSPITTPFGSLAITTSGPGTTLTFTDTTWALSTNLTLNATLTTPSGTFTGMVTLTGNANGTYTTNGMTITFTLASASGSATYNVQTPSGQTFSGTFSLPSSGLQGLVGLSGAATFGCAPTALTLVAPIVTMGAQK